MQQEAEEEAIGRAPFKHSRLEFRKAWHPPRKNSRFHTPDRQCGQVWRQTTQKSEWQFEDDKVTMMNKVFSEKGARKQTNNKANRRLLAVHRSACSVNTVHTLTV